MEIHAGGKTWKVETQSFRPIDTEGESFCGVTFLDLSDRDMRVAIGWVPGSGRLTSSAARRLFELAGERVWKDPRTGVAHRVLLKDGPDDLHGPMLTARFATAAGSSWTPYDLEVSLGMAEDAALQGLRDRALRRGPGRLGLD